MTNIINFPAKKVTTLSGDALILDRGITLEWLCHEFNVLHVCSISINGNSTLFAIADVGNILSDCGDEEDYVAIFYRSTLAMSSCLWFSEHMLLNDGAVSIYDLTKAEWESELKRFLMDFHKTTDVYLDC